MLKKSITVFLALGCWIAYIVHGNNVTVTEFTYHTPKNNHPKEYHRLIEDMSDDEFRAFVLAQNPHDPEPVEIDTTVHYTAEQLADFKQLMSGGPSSSSLAQQQLQSGDAVFTGVSSDNHNESVQTNAIGSKVPDGYHTVKGYTTKTGKVVPTHLAKNRISTSKTTATSSSSKDLSTPIFTRNHDLAQRSLISQQNFPSQTLSGNDSTIIIGTH